MQPAAELVAREGVSLREAATRLKIPLTTEEAALAWRSKLFQKLLRAERLRYNLEISNDPGWSRRAAVGKMLYLVDRLIEAGEHDKALEGLLKVAKVEGWLSADTNVNVFGALTDKELLELKAKIAERANNEGDSAAEQLSN